MLSKTLSGLSGRFNNSDFDSDFQSALESADERFGDAKRTVFQDVGNFDSVEDYAETLRGEAKEVASAYETRIREQITIKKERVYFVSIVDEIYDGIVGELYDEIDGVEK
jgi:hypothetical protein